MVSMTLAGAGIVVVLLPAADRSQARESQLVMIVCPSIPMSKLRSRAGPPSGFMQS